MKSVELFAGAGGLGLGLSLAGFEPEAVIEWNKWACDTIRENQSRGYSPGQGLEHIRGGCASVRLFPDSRGNRSDLRGLSMPTLLPGRETQGP